MNTNYNSKVYTTCSFKACTEDFQCLWKRTCMPILDILLISTGQIIVILRTRRSILHRNPHGHQYWAYKCKEGASNDHGDHAIILGGWIVFQFVIKMGKIANYCVTIHFDTYISVWPSTNDFPNHRRSLIKSFSITYVLAEPSTVTSRGISIVAVPTFRTLISISPWVLVLVSISTSASIFICTLNRSSESRSLRLVEVRNDRGV